MGQWAPRSSAAARAAAWPMAEKATPCREGFDGGAAPCTILTLITTITHQYAFSDRRQQQRRPILADTNQEGGRGDRIDARFEAAEAAGQRTMLESAPLSMPASLRSSTPRVDTGVDARLEELTPAAGSTEKEKEVQNEVRAAIRAKLREQMHLGSTAAFSPYPIVSGQHPRADAGWIDISGMVQGTDQSEATSTAADLPLRIDWEPWNAARNSPSAWSPAWVERWMVSLVWEEAHRKIAAKVGLDTPTHHGLGPEDWGTPLQGALPGRCRCEARGGEGATGSKGGDAAAAAATMDSNGSGSGSGEGGEAGEGGQGGEVFPVKALRREAAEQKWSPQQITPAWQLTKPATRVRPSDAIRADQAPTIGMGGVEAKRLAQVVRIAKLDAVQVDAKRRVSLSRSISDAERPRDQLPSLSDGQARNEILEHAPAVSEPQQRALDLSATPIRPPTI
ncbi:uncharacterized protein PSFLO_06873 [Pseudozyma flocculosa]|uniref:Uncharacterized protein n=1 Tax=Pseudozyma flocculosa TaxID=84751 RepID=A0A5C3FD53_9BASI|nr:uncharacterized protein PSFLO_06873 [Pseudozyma flocculosa]